MAVTKITKEGNNIVLKNDADNILGVIGAEDFNLIANTNNSIGMYVTYKTTDRGDIASEWGINVEDITDPAPAGAVWDRTELMQYISDNFTSVSSGDLTLVNPDGSDISVENPLQVSGNDITIGDIDWDASNFTGWTGDPKHLFDEISNGGIYNDSADNPKTFTIVLKRTKTMRLFGLGTNIGNFSNLKATLLGSATSERGVLDLSEDNSKETSLVYSQEEFTFNALRVEFFTADRIDVTNIYLSYSYSARKQDYVLKWGLNPEIDSGGNETIWDNGGIYTFTEIAQSYYISSSSTLDNVQEIFVETIGINAEGYYQRELTKVALAGNTKTLIPTNLLCVASNRAFNDSSQVLDGNVYIYEDDTVTGGIPDDSTKIRSVIFAGKEQTQQAVYTVPEFTEDGRKVAFSELYNWDCAAIRNRSTAGLVELYVASKNKAARVQDSDALSEVRKSGSNFGENTPLVIQPASDVFINVSEVTTNNVAVKAGFTIKLVVL